jgi:hypothetical protein
MCFPGALCRCSRSKAEPVSYRRYWLIFCAQQSRLAESISAAPEHSRHAEQETLFSLCFMRLYASFISLGAKCPLANAAPT